MIKCKKGNVVLKGSRAEVVAEFICIAKGVFGVAPLELDMAMKHMEEELKAKKEAKADEDEAVTDPELS